MFSKARKFGDFAHSGDEVCNMFHVWPGRALIWRPLQTSGLPWWLKMVKKLPVIQETQIQSLGQKDLLEKGMATHFRVRALRRPWTEEFGGLQSVGSQRLGHDWVASTFTFTDTCKSFCYFSKNTNFPLKVWNRSDLSWCGSSSVSVLTSWRPWKIIINIRETISTSHSCLWFSHLDSSDPRIFLPSCYWTWMQTSSLNGIHLLSPRILIL